MKSPILWLLGGIGTVAALVLCLPAGEEAAQRVATTGSEVRARLPLANAAASLHQGDAVLQAEIQRQVRDKYVQRNAGDTVTELDEYSALLDPGAYEDMKVATHGSYAGVGIEIVSQDGRVAVERVIRDSPAARAGLQAGDLIEAIDGALVSTHRLDAATTALRGDPGTPVALGIRRGARTLQIRLRRGRVELASVQSARLQSDMGYVRITSFTDGTEAEFAAHLKALRGDSGRPLRGLVLDLRNNPGGVLDAAVAVADQLLEAGIIVSGDGRADDARFLHRATPGDASGGAAIAVLVNGGTASASEILAAALQDNGRAVLVGRRTYGKGSVQTIMPLSGGRALKLTTSRYFTPSGASLDHNGIMPDVQLPGHDVEPDELDAAGQILTLARRDPEVGVALQRLRQRPRSAAAVRAVPTVHSSH